ncbi:hypothetical protein FHQ26_08150 [Testudinibacter sp. TR-2022]|uniref:ubiquinone biosynthesis accessory factor UbiJ n=1 Tax=Testudinibacter sp. TR-2022 TaxID=2585029 RepID=UPI0011196DDD|nr:SCP2 sterol-binding domain-containing protein [Testudinibacter sp. TR-2022]TNH02062.1 hypothetical protein FHQ22_10655 [Pasteurellaceae bacterium Phil31]TNH07561.1 hypothetical protein FHQ25_11010 [Testudinibacter sp. TR-2022]TNH08611.1 hypothetical protein FHQ26_08150 [Testudinibacter sp. TR-2022]TNH14880.1 hypothetical protein FIA56_04190 [Testudinibacter sp. TR-2022]TNH19208.1 hypothetical protein FHQ23_04005 [Testudinibacter sp. TR-2022]
MLPSWAQIKTQFILPQLAAAALETALSHLLKNTENYQPLLRKLNGKVLALQLQQPEISYYFIFSEQAIDVLQQYEGIADCSLQTSAKILLKLPKKSELSHYINDKSIVIHGDLQVLQDFLGLMAFLQTDPAELLSPYVGDVLAYNASKLLQQGLNFLANKQQTASWHWDERFSEEWQIVTPKLAFADFQTQVAQVQQQCDQLEHQFQQLQSRIAAKIAEKEASCD